MLDRFRRPPAVVLWGGRLGVDLQAGSPADRRRAARLIRLAELERRLAADFARANRAMRAVGVSAAQAIERMRPAVEALNRVAREHHARQLSGAAALGRALATAQARDRDRLER